MIFLKDKVNLAFVSAYVILVSSFIYIPANPSVKVILYILIFSFSFLIYLYLFFRNKNKIDFSFKEIILIALLFKIILLFVQPITTEDYTRYIWDGKVQSSSGINPFKYAPQDTALSHLRDNDIYPQLTFKEIKTIYPPFAQLIFLLNQFIFSGSLIGLKILFLLFDLGVIYFLYKIILHLDLNKHSILLYTLSPLVLLEVNLNAHVDILLLFFLTGSIYFCLKRNVSLAFLFLGFSVMAKIYSILFLPLLLVYFFDRKNFKTLLIGLIFFIIPCLIILPYMNGLSGILETMKNYNDNWYFNALPFKAVAELFRYYGMENHKIIRSAFSILFLFILGYLTFSSKPFLTKLTLIIFFYFLLNTTVHPWYLIILSAVLVFNFNYTFLFWTGIVGLTNLTVYQYKLSGVWGDNNYVLAFEYVVLILAFILEYKTSFNLKQSTAVTNE
ncbi:DUF2029 domain-containing protein [soil metagenome]